MQPGLDSCNRQAPVSDLERLQSNDQRSTSSSPNSSLSQQQPHVQDLLCSQLMQQQQRIMEHAADITATQGVAAQNAFKPAPKVVPRASSALDKELLQQQHALEPLLPTPTNINPIHVSREDLIPLVKVQQWVQQHLNIKLPLLNGTFVLAPSQHSSSTRHLLQAQQQTSGSLGSASSTAAAAAVAAAVPWRLRQVSCVEVCAGVDPADATVVLVGGGRVRAGAVKQGQLAEVQEHQYLCCEVAALQLSGQLCQLQVFDVAHMAWRLQVACQLDQAITRFEQDQAAMAAIGPAAASVMKAAASRGVELVGSFLKKLPPPNWISEQVLSCIELNPIVWPESPDQPWQLLSDSQYTQLMQDAAAAWQHYVQQKLAGQQPQPVTDFVPWLVLDSEGSDPTATAAAAAAVSAGACGKQLSQEQDQELQPEQHSNQPDCAAGTVAAAASGRAVDTATAMQPGAAESCKSLINVTEEPAAAQVSAVTAEGIAAAAAAAAARAHADKAGSGEPSSSRDNQGAAACAAAPAAAATPAPIELTKPANGSGSGSSKQGSGLRRGTPVGHDTRSSRSSREGKAELHKCSSRSSRGDSRGTVHKHSSRDTADRQASRDVPHKHGSSGGTDVAGQHSSRDAMPKPISGEERDAADRRSSRDKQETLQNLRSRRSSRDDARGHSGSGCRDAVHGHSSRVSRELSDKVSSRGSKDEAGRHSRGATEKPSSRGGAEEVGKDSRGVADKLSSRGGEEEAGRHSSKDSRDGTSEPSSKDGKYEARRHSSKDSRVATANPSSRGGQEEVGKHTSRDTTKQHSSSDTACKISSRAARDSRDTAPKHRSSDARGSSRSEQPAAAAAGAAAAEAGGQSQPGGSKADIPALPAQGGSQEHADAPVAAAAGGGDGVAAATATAAGAGSQDASRKRLRAVGAEGAAQLADQGQPPNKVQRSDPASTDLEQQQQQQQHEQAVGGEQCAKEQAEEQQQQQQEQQPMASLQQRQEQQQQPLMDSKQEPGLLQRSDQQQQQGEQSLQPPQPPQEQALPAGLQQSHEQAQQIEQQLPASAADQPLPPQQQQQSPSADEDLEEGEVLEEGELAEQGESVQPISNSNTGSARAAGSSSRAKNMQPAAQSGAKAAQRTSSSAKAAGASKAGTTAGRTAGGSTAPDDLVQARVQAWLEKFALLLPLARDKTGPPCRMFLGELSKQLPVPACVVKHYGTVTRFVTVTRGLKWAGDTRHVTLEPSFHVQLRWAARAAEGTSREAAALRQPAAAPAAAAAGGGGKPLRVEQQQQQQQAEVRDLKRKDFQESNPRPLKRQAAAAAAKGSTRAAGTAAADSAATAETAVQAGYKWVTDLAMYLPPGQGVNTAELRRVLPVPRTLVKQYGSASMFFYSVQGLRYNAAAHSVSLEPDVHRQLREAAAAADAAARLRGAGLPTGGAGHQGLCYLIPAAQLVHLKY